MAEQKQNINPKQVSELLESDDEFPDSFEDIPFTPAYENDCRFEPIRFPWLEQYSKTNKVEQPISQNVLSSESKQIKKGTLISKGTLSKSDLFIVRSIKDYVEDETWLWFVEFLYHKYVQPYRIGCLVANIMNKQLTNTVNVDSTTIKKSAYKLVIKTLE